MTTLHIKPENTECYFAIWALGLLHAMKANRLPFEAGIWTLARPNILYKIQTDISEKLHTLFQTLDELDALAKLGGHDVTIQTIDKLIDELNQMIETHSEYYAFELGVSKSFQAA